MNTIEKLQKQTAQYAVEYITGKGMHTGIAWLRDSFNELCETMGINEYNPNDIGFNLDEIVTNLKKEPWVAEIAAKTATQRTHEENSRVVEDFICKYWMMQLEEVTAKDVTDILTVADPLSKRHMVANKVAINCIYALNQEQLHRLDEVLNVIEKNPDLGKSKGIDRLCRY